MIQESLKQLKLHDSAIYKFHNRTNEYILWNVPFKSTFVATIYICVTWQLYWRAISYTCWCRACWRARHSQLNAVRKPRGKSKVICSEARSILFKIHPHYRGLKETFQLNWFHTTALSNLTQHSDTFFKTAAFTYTLKENRYLSVWYNHAIHHTELPITPLHLHQHKKQIHQLLLQWVPKKDLKVTGGSGVF